MDGTGWRCDARAARLPPVLQRPWLRRLLPQRAGGREAFDGGGGRSGLGMDERHVGCHAARSARAADGRGDGMRVASAPVSFGIFELTTDDAGLPDPVAVLDAMVDADYKGTELGPPGYFGDARGTAAALSERGLSLVGSFLPMRLSRREHEAEDFAYL